MHRVATMAILSKPLHLRAHEMIVQLLLEDQLFVCALITITDFGFDNVTRSHFEYIHEILDKYL